ncbi:MAG: pilus assembly protein TadG-related protein, partial [Eubacteriales bacterium]
MKRFFTEEKGSVLIITVLVIVVLLSFTALAVDAGYLYFRHTRLQDTADAAALASAIELAKNSGSANNAHQIVQAKDKAFAVAKNYAIRNDLDVSPVSGYTVEVTCRSSGESGLMSVNFPDGLKKTTVTIKLGANLYFAQVLGKDSTDIGVTATAQVGQAGRQTGGIIPVAVVDDPNNPNDGNYIQWKQYEMTLGPSEGTNGNYGWLDFGSYEGVNGNELEYYLRYGYPGSLSVNQWVYTKTG